MDIMSAIKKRKSVRIFLEKDVEEEKLRVILEAARLAPSASNRQEWRFIVVRDKEKRLGLMKAAKSQSSVGEAPVVIACCAETDNHLMTCGQACYPIDVAIAIDHMTLMAVELGLGTCWIGAFYEEEVKKVLDIPKEIRVVELLPLGYPKDPRPVEKERKSFKEIVSLESWGRAYV
jgi:nitroreductase